MHGSLQQILQHAWVGWAFGLAMGLAVATPLAFLNHIRCAKGADNSITREQLEKQQQIKLLCGDAKALADLAIQRHLSDAVFFQRLQTQPCYAVLSPYLSDEFRRLLAQDPMAEDGRAALANACLQEIERLECGLANTPPR